MPRRSMQTRKAQSPASCRAVRQRAWICMALSICWLASFAGNASAAEPPPRIGTISRAARQDALRGIPLDRLDADARAKAQAVCNQSSLFRRMPVETIDCDPNFYLFLVRNPEVIVEIWQLMGVTDLKLQRTGPETFRAVDNAGTSGDVEFLYGDQNTHILYIQGQYRGPLYPRPINANCVLILQTRYARDANGRYRITSQLDSFVAVKNLGVELVAKTFQNVFGKTTDHNFVETAQFLSKLSQVAEQNPNGAQRMAARLAAVDPKVREQFSQLVTQMGSAAATAQAAAPKMAAATTASTGAVSSRRPSETAPRQAVADQDAAEEPPFMRPQSPAMRR